MNPEEKRARQRDASRRYRNSLTEEQKQVERKKKRARKKRFLASMTDDELESWRARERKYHRNYISSLGPEKLNDRKAKQAKANKRWIEKKARSNRTGAAKVPAQSTRELESNEKDSTEVGAVVA